MKETEILTDVVNQTLTNNDTLFVDPRNTKMVKVSHSVTNANYSMNCITNKILWIAIGKCQVEAQEHLDVTMPLSETMKMLKLTDGGENYKYITKLITDSKNLDVIINTEIETPKGIKKQFVKMPWFQLIAVTEGGSIRIRLNDMLRPYIIEVKKNYRLFEIEKLISCNNKYALRWYQLIRRNEGFAGKNGNPARTWYDDYMISDIKEQFQIPEGKYPLTSDFRKRVIEDPIKEINAAGLGIEISIDTKKHKIGRELKGIRLVCKLEKEIGIEKKKVAKKEVKNEQREIECEKEFLRIHEERYEELIKQEKTASDEMNLKQRSTQVASFKALEALAKEQDYEKFKIEYYAIQGWEILNP